MRRVAVFDFDGTLTRCDTFIGFARLAVGCCKLCWALALSLPKILLWKIGIIPSDNAKECLFRHLYARCKADTLLSVAARYNPPLREEIMEKLREHQKCGDTVILISASVDVWVAPWAKRHGVNHICCTRAEVDTDGIITGRFATPNCRGEEKVRRLLELEPCRSQYHLTAYGDSSGDTAMLRFADIAHKI